VVVVVVSLCRYPRMVTSCGSCVLVSSTSRRLGKCYVTHWLGGSFIALTVYSARTHHPSLYRTTTLVDGTTMTKVVVLVVVVVVIVMLVVVHYVSKKSPFLFL